MYRFEVKTGYNGLMSLKYDLHAHSKASDGSLSPSELVARAANLGVNVLALTDHDTLAGIAEARQQAGRCGIRLISGVEISVSWGGRVIHLLGLGVDLHCSELQKGLKRLQEHRGWRAREMGHRLDKAGISGAYEGAKALSGGNLIARTHFARYLVQKGVVPNLRKVFKHYLVRGKPGYVAGDWASLEEAVAWVQAAKGQVVVAHPARYSFTRSKLRRLLSEFTGSGGVGLEVVSGSHSREDIIKMSRYANDFGLLASAGSDFHGPAHQWLELGRLPELPSICQPIWEEWGPTISNTEV